MRKTILGILVALLVCATGLFASLSGNLNLAEGNDKDPVVGVPEGIIPIA